MMKNTAGQYVIIQIYVLEYFYFMSMADYPFKTNEFCCHGALFQWHRQHFLNMACLSNMATFTRFFAQNNRKFNRQDMLLCITHE